MFLKSPEILKESLKNIKNFTFCNGKVIMTQNPVIKEKNHKFAYVKSIYILAQAR